MYDSIEFVKMFGQKRRIWKDNVWWTFPRYPRKIVSGSPESLKGSWWFENLPQNGLSGGSKFRAYIRARCMAIQTGCYNTRSHRIHYVMFACPKGILP